METIFIKFFGTDYCRKTDIHNEFTERWQFDYIYYSLMNK